MCGFLTYMGSNYSLSQIEEASKKIAYRGPDSSSCKTISQNVVMAFHRLAIIDQSSLGEQPLFHPNDSSIALVCNGEIYNYKSLIQSHSLNVKSDSDCEVILHLYKRYGIEKTLEMLDGVFAFTLYDSKVNILFAARDPLGIRPSFIGWDKKGGVSIASEMKALIDICDKNIIPFPPGSWWASDVPCAFTGFTEYFDNRFKEQDEKEACENIKKLLTDSVKKRMMSDREIGCLLSGGLDSSLISSLVASMTEDRKKLKTFSIGMKGSPDLNYAKIVADHIGSDHHSIQLSQQEFLDAIETVIYNIESYDTTTVRASVGNYLVARYIRDNTDVKVVFNGDGADEVCMGYIYNCNAPSIVDFYNENINLVNEIHAFDVLRSDRCVSSNGLEARTPFLDKQFVKYCMSIPPEMKMFGENGKPEKYLLRKAFEASKLLPDEILWRRKCAFSDGVSSIKNSWHKTLQDFINSRISDEEFERDKIKINHCSPMLKESYYYRKIFDKFFSGHSHVIPHFWMPKWTDTIDPSARELSGYKE